MWGSSSIGSPTAARGRSPFARQARQCLSARRVAPGINPLPPDRIWLPRTPDASLRTRQSMLSAIGAPGMSTSTPSPAGSASVCCYRSRRGPATSASPSWQAAHILVEAGDPLRVPRTGHVLVPAQLVPIVNHCPHCRGSAASETTIDYPDDTQVAAATSIARSSSDPSITHVSLCLDNHTGSLTPLRETGAGRARPWQGP